MPSSQVGVRGGNLPILQSKSFYCLVAQLTERLTLTQEVVGLYPTGAAKQTVDKTVKDCILRLPYNADIAPNGRAAVCQIAGCEFESDCFHYSL